MFPMTHWVHRNHQEPHQDTPVLHNSNWGGIRMGRFLTGFLGAFLGGVPLTTMTLWIHLNSQKHHQETPVLYNFMRVCDWVQWNWFSDGVFVGGLIFW